VAQMQAKTQLKSNSAYYDVMQEILNALQGSTYYTNVPSQKVYRAKLTQNGTLLSNPTASVLQNTTGVTPVFNAVNTGSYEITGSGLFAATSYMNAHLGAIGQTGTEFVCSLQRSGSDAYGVLDVHNSSSIKVDGFDPIFVEIVLHA
jgi:hypothetical protein